MIILVAVSKDKKRYLVLESICHDPSESDISCEKVLNEIFEVVPHMMVPGISIFHIKSEKINNSELSKAVIDFFPARDSLCIKTFMISAILSLDFTQFPSEVRNKLLSHNIIITYDDPLWKSGWNSKKLKPLVSMDYKTYTRE